MYNILAIIALIASCHFLLRLLKPRGAAEYVSAFFLISTALIVLQGFILSFAGHLNNAGAWAFSGLVTLGISTTVVLYFDRQAVSLPKFDIGVLREAFSFIRDLSGFEKVILAPTAMTVLALGMLNITVILFTAPHNWDSMSYHLARVAYYLQNNSLGYFDANYWAQVVHPKNASILLIYTYLVSFRNENFTQLVQFASYWVAVCSVYGISRKIGFNKAQSLFAALVSALLTEWLMQATTTQNDMLQAAYLGAIVYFLFAFKESQNHKYIFLTSLAMGLSIGTKASSLLTLPSVAIIAAFVLLSGDLHLRLRYFTVLSTSALAAVILFALPVGYLENYRVFGHPIGPDETRKLHSFEGESLQFIVKNGSKNLLRYGFDFLVLDGLPPVSRVEKAQTVIRRIPVSLVNKLGIDLETPEATLRPFKLTDVPILSHEDNSYWGILGFSLVWIGVLASIAWSANTRVLALATIMFFISQAFAGSYDPWRGRYFIACAILAVPTVGMFLGTKNWLMRTYLLVVVVVGCLSATSAVMLRDNSSIITVNYKSISRVSIFSMDRMEQLTRNRSRYLDALVKFEQLVPKQATVAVFFQEDSFEYPLFGDGLTRTIIPLNSFVHGIQPIPPNADYLLYSSNGFPCPQSSDTHLGETWYLRKLSDVNRTCP